MTALTMPTLERRLFQAAKEEAEAKSVSEWPKESVETCLVLIREIRARTVRMLETLEAILAEGIEARAFKRDFAPLLPAAESDMTAIREFVEKLSSSEDDASGRILAALHSLEEVEETYRDLLAEVLARASNPHPSLDWERLKSESDADFKAGRFVSFTTNEEMLEGLTDKE